MMNPLLQPLHPYPFEKLAKLLAPMTPADLSPILLSIGEPKHPAPDFVKQILVNSLDKLSVYPTTKGIPQLSEAIARWLEQRFHLTHVDENTQVIPVNGTREALFSFTQACLGYKKHDTRFVVMPNPFYQIYEGATLLAGAIPYFVNCTAENQYLGDFDAIPDDVWAKTELLFLCSPGNPTGAVLPEHTLRKLIAKADEFNFVIASDECYSELYFDTPPIGLLEVCANMGRHDYARCVVFHSLSKRSNLPGMRSGFVAGDATILKDFLKYRTYHGAALPVQHQLASIAAWQDEQHVVDNRQRYQQKFDLMVSQLGHRFALTKPDASFYFWLPVDNDETTAQQWYQHANITVLPGRYLSREVNGINPGAGHIRMALVADIPAIEEVIQRLLTL